MPARVFIQSRGLDDAGTMQKVAFDVLLPLSENYLKVLSYTLTDYTLAPVSTAWHLLT